MRNYFAASLVTVVLGSVMLTGGCVSQGQYDDLLAQNRAAAAALERANALINKQLADIDALKKAIDELNAQIKLKDGQIQVLTDARDALQRKLDALASRGPAQLPAPERPIGVLPAGLNEKLKALAERYKEFMSYENGVVKFKSDTTFDPGSDVVTPQAKEAMVKLAEIMNTPEALEFHMYVAGHTDDLPIVKPETKRRHPDNWYLSVHRAVAVEEVFQKNAITPERLAAMGFGEYHPVAPNAAGHKGNKLNRRVEIWILPSDRFLTVDGGKAETTPAKEPKEPVDKAPADTGDEKL